MRRGVMMIMLLVTMAIIVLLYFIEFRTLFQVREPTDPTAQWLEGGRILKEGKQVPLPNPPQPPLELFAARSADITQYKDPRGTLEITVGADGRVTGTWNAMYRVGDIEYTVAAKAEGNVDTSRVYQADGEMEPSRLLIVGQGTFTRQGYNSRIQRSDNTDGRAYLNGWLTPDGRGQGEFFLVRSNNSYEAFQWAF